MRKKATCIISVVIVIFAIISLIFILDKKNLQLPESKQLNYISFIEVVNEHGVIKTTISDKTDIENILNILKNPKSTNIDSISDTPNKKQFTIILFKHSDGGSSWSSIYEENQKYYLDQPYCGVFNFELSDINMLNSIIKNGYKVDISIPLNQLIK